MSVTDEIKARLDIVNYINQFVPLKKAGRNYKACCPFHSENTPSFFVDPDRQSWRCFGACAEGGDIFTFAQKFHGYDFREALEQLGKQAGVEVRKQTPQDKQKAEHLDRLRGLIANVADIYHKNLIDPQTDQAKATLRYATEKRGLSLETIKTFKVGFALPGWQNIFDDMTHLGYSVDDLLDAGLVIKKEETGRVYDRFRNRLMIPIRDDRGRLIAFGARTMDPDDNAKYLNSPQSALFDKSKVLFGLDTAKKTIREQEMAVIVEGYMDVIQAQQAGFLNVIAQMGTAMTEAQLKLIAPRYARKVILALDSDAAGQSATRRSLETARATLEADFAGRMAIDIRVLQIPEAKDPDDLIREQPQDWQELIDKALPVADFVIQMETRDLGPDVGFGERQAIAQRILPILAASENNIYNQENIQKLALKLGIAERDLLNWSKMQLPKQEKRRPAQQPPPPPDIEPLDMVDDSFYYEGMEADSSAQPSTPSSPPPDDLTPIYVLPKSPSQVPGKGREGHLLRLIFLNPDLYYTVNRQLRELAEGDDVLLNEPLSDFSVGDFTHSEYRALMQMFLFGIKQAGADLIDFLHDELAPEMAAELNWLLRDDDVEISDALKRRYQADVADLVAKSQKQVRSPMQTESDLLATVFDLRRRRLVNLIEEIRLKQGADNPQVMQRILVIRHGIDKIDRALDRQRQQSI